MKRARRALTEALPHFEQSEELIAEILRDLPELENRYFGTGEPIPGGKKGYLIISGDKGLAGAYNHNIVKFAEGILKNEKDPIVFVVGQLGAALPVQHSTPRWSEPDAFRRCCAINSAAES